MTNWKLVPVEPTPEMCAVICNAGCIYLSEDELYVALLEAAPPAPSVPDMRLTGQWESSRIADYNRGWNECRQAMLSAAPTPAEAPADVARDAEPWKLLLENLVEGLNKTHWSSWQGTAHFDEYLQEAISAIERDKLKGQS